ncbi:hemerythrin domain-containing protein [Nocardioides sp. JQ2195]|nr:hemerythrin domain-containing protein [Nocardioides sp. JQ2195]
MDEHYALLDDAHEVRRALGAGDRAGASRLMERLVAHLDVHVRREERGIFTAMRSQGEFVEEVQQLEGEHRSLDAAIGGLDPEDPGFDDVVSELFRELSEHIDRENLGIFPVSVVTLGASGWELVQQARDELPSFLPSLHD